MASKESSSAPRIIVMPQPAALRPFTGQDEANSVRTFIAACEDVMKFPPSLITVTKLHLFAASVFLILWQPCF